MHKVLGTLSIITLISIISGCSDSTDESATDASPVTQEPAPAPPVPAESDPIADDPLEEPAVAKPTTSGRKPIPPITERAKPAEIVEKAVKVITNESNSLTNSDVGSSAIRRAPESNWKENQEKAAQEMAVREKEATVAAELAAEEAAKQAKEEAAENAAAEADSTDGEAPEGDSTSDPEPNNR